MVPCEVVWLGVINLFSPGITGISVSGIRRVCPGITVGPCAEILGSVSVGVGFSREKGLFGRLGKNVLRGFGKRFRFDGDGPVLGLGVGVAVTVGDEPLPPELPPLEPPPPLLLGVIMALAMKAIRLVVLIVPFNGSSVAIFKVWFP